MLPPLGAAEPALGGATVAAAPAAPLVLLSPQAPAPRSAASAQATVFTRSLEGSVKLGQFGIGGSRSGGASLGSGAFARIESIGFRTNLLRVTSDALHVERVMN
jgi:hypothetical protein